jgi:hypothetical protein
MDTRPSDRQPRSPRDRVLTLLLAALAAAQLLALYALCQDQVRRAESRQVAVTVERQASGDCPQPIAPSLARPCVPGPDGHAGPTASAAWR